MRLVGKFFEMLLALVLFILLLPLFLFAVLLVQIDSPGRIIFKQPRIGKNGKPFILYKLRTMKRGANGNFPVHTQVNDERFSPLCRLIRATTIDEIPQLVNVMKGEMSLVGPRPERPQVVTTYTPTQRDILRFTPGLFGISQLAFREGVIVDKKLSLELKYYPQRTALSDIKIVCYTPFILLKDTFSKLVPSSNHRGDRTEWISEMFIAKGN